VPVEPTATVDPNVTVEPTATTAPPSSQELASQGAGIYESNCTGCHSRDSDTKIGPGHRNVYSRAATRVSGLSAGDYIRQSLLDPSAFVVSGFPSIMPKFSFFTDVQILALIEYLKSL
jgi:cytochrome c oxidase subunit 2